MSSKHFEHLGLLWRTAPKVTGCHRYLLRLNFSTSGRLPSLGGPHTTGVHQGFRNLIPKNKVSARISNQNSPSFVFSLSIQTFFGSSFGLLALVKIADFPGPPLVGPPQPPPPMTVSPWPWPSDAQAAPYWAAMASGLQNAMCTMHFGAVVPRWND